MTFDVYFQPVVLSTCSFVAKLVFFQNDFLVEMEKIVTQKRSVRLVKDGGWYSEAEMRNELQWSSSLESI